MNIAACIKSLLEDYRAQPLARMREIGIQSRLHRLIGDGLTDKTCRMQIRIGGHPNPAQTCHSVERVQMEVRVTKSGGHGPGKSDIVVLRSTLDDAVGPITATRYGRGAFDIISKIEIADVAAVIEVKAACSADFQQRHLFRSDLKKLLELQNFCEDTAVCPELHFVLIDKSVAIEGQQNENFGIAPLSSAMPTHNWNVEREDFLAAQTSTSRTKFWDESHKADLLLELPNSGKFVHVWEIAHKDGISSSPEPLHRYAVSKP